MPKRSSDLKDFLPGFFVFAKVALIESYKAQKGKRKERKVGDDALGKRKISHKCGKPKEAANKQIPEENSAKMPFRLSSSRKIRIAPLFFFVGDKSGIRLLRALIVPKFELFCTTFRLFTLAIFWEHKSPGHFSYSSLHQQGVEFPPRTQLSLPNFCPIYSPRKFGKL